MSTLRALPSPSWERLLSRNNEGGVKKTLSNVALILYHDSEWLDCIAFDEFKERLIIARECPAGEPRDWDDNADYAATIWLQRSKYKLDVGHELVAHAAKSVGARCRVHPLREKLRSLVWDGVPRVDTWTSRYLGSEDTPAHREMGLRWMIGAVARAFVPGCQHDLMLILEGNQGIRKSSALRILALGFFTDELADFGSKDAAQQMHGTWIVEIAELDAFERADVRKIKAFLVRRIDRYRAPYGRHVENHPRQCVFAGTVNHNDYLKDETGGRRFLPIRCGAIDIDALKSDVEQLWAEAVVRYRKGELNYTTDEALNKAIAELVADRYIGDVWTAEVENYTRLNRDTTIADVLRSLGIDVADRTHAHAQRVAKILKSLGFERYFSRTGTRPEWRYRPIQPVRTGVQAGSAKSLESIQKTNPDPADPADPGINETTGGLVKNTNQRPPVASHISAGSPGSDPDQSSDEDDSDDRTVEDDEGDNWWERD